MYIASEKRLKVMVKFLLSRKTNPNMLVIEYSNLFNSTATCIEHLCVRTGQLATVCVALQCSIIGNIEYFDFISIVMLGKT